MHREDQIAINRAQIVRIVSAPIVLASPIPLWLKLTIIYFLDTLDCGMLKLFNQIRDEDCKTEFYQKSDKIVDSISYTMILIYMNDKIPQDYKYILWSMYAYRIIGVIDFITNGNEDVLISHPDLFREYSIYVSLVDSPALSLQNGITIAALLAWKFDLEKMIHSNKK